MFSYFHRMQRQTVFVPTMTCQPSITSPFSSRVNNNKNGDPIKNEIHDLSQYLKKTNMPETKTIERKPSSKLTKTKVKVKKPTGQLRTSTPTRTIKTFVTATKTPLFTLLSTTPSLDPLWQLNHKPHNKNKDQGACFAFPQF
jgi:hypothetical protein